MTKTHIRHDAGQLGSPVRLASGDVRYTGVAARLHTPKDPLVYTDESGGLRREHRDLSELRAIVDGLQAKPLLLAHFGPRIGHVERAWLADGERAAVSLVVDHVGQRAIADGTHELSLGYFVRGLDENNFQRGTRVDHLALVESARCGSTCSVRRDRARADCTATCGCPTTGRANQGRGEADRLRAQLRAAFPQMAVEGRSIDWLRGAAGQLATIDSARTTPRVSPRDRMVERVVASSAVQPTSKENKP